MADDKRTTDNLWDFVPGKKGIPNMPNLKVVVGKLSAIPGLSQFKTFQIQMLRIHEELLKGQAAIIEQVIQALEAVPDGSGATSPESSPPANRKIVIS